MPNCWKALPIVVVVGDQQVFERGRADTGVTAPYAVVDSLEAAEGWTFFNRPFDAEVVLLGRQGDEHIDAYELARSAGTIHYEVLTNVSRRVPRFYG